LRFAGGGIGADLGVGGQCHGLECGQGLARAVEFGAYLVGDLGGESSSGR
jgi:hypothetical protein